MFTPKGIMFLALGFALLSLSCSGPESDQPVLTAELPLYLEDHLNDARIEGSEIPSNIHPSIEWNFNEPQPDWKTTIPRPFPAGIRPPMVSQTNNALQITLGPSNANPNGELVGGAFVNIPEWDHRDWAHVIIKARSSGQGSIELGFNIGEREGHPDEGWPFPYEMGGVRDISLVNDGAIHTYELPLEPSESREEPIRQLGLWIMADDPLEIEILSVTVEPIDSLYAVEPVGIRCAELYNGHRRSLFVHTPAKIEYRIQVPAEGRLDTALGTLWSESPAIFRVTLRTDSGEDESLLEESHGERKTWLHKSIDLSAYTGQVITLSLEAESARTGSVALWGAPTLTGSRKETAEPSITFMRNRQDAKTKVPTDPIKIDTGYISGTMIGEIGKEVLIYRGIPYAAPPIGKLRWRPPQPPAPWSGIRECTVFGKASPGVQLIETGGQSEDCLYLNVLTPAKKASDNLPVMFWLPPADASAIGRLENSPRLPQNGVVLVTVTHRHGAFGLLGHPLLSKESPTGVSDNYMFLDIIAALEWVQRNIAAFGGNPENVTIFGMSAGAFRASCLMASPLANGLFHKAILESGVTGKFWHGIPMKNREAVGERIFARLGVDKEDDPLRAARALPLEKIMNTPGSTPWPEIAIDGQVMTNAPPDVFEEGRQNPMPLIVCATLGELTHSKTQTNFDFFIPDYVNVLNGANKAGQKGYACVFDQVPSKWKQECCLSHHGMELPYVFGDWDNSTGIWSSYFNQTNDPFLDVKTPDPGLTDIDRKVSENMMAMWTQFARTGDPNLEGLINWPAYDSGTDQYLYITEPLQVKSGFSEVGQKE